MGGKRITDVDAYVARRIQMLRLVRGISQRRIASELEITYQQVQKYEKGRDRVSAGVLYHLAELLAVDVAFFFEGLDGKAPDLLIRGTRAPTQKVKKRLRPR